MSGGVVAGEADRADQDGEVMSIVVWRNSVPEPNDDEDNLDDKDNEKNKDNVEDLE